MRRFSMLLPCTGMMIRLSLEKNSEACSKTNKRKLSAPHTDHLQVAQESRVVTDRHPQVRVPHDRIWPDSRPTLGARNTLLVGKTIALWAPGKQKPART